MTAPLLLHTGQQCAGHVLAAVGEPGWSGEAAVAAYRRSAIPAVCPVATRRELGDVLAEMGVEGLLQLQQDDKALTEAVAEAVQVPSCTLIACCW